ncbi:transcriptional regulator [Chromobacterium phragmitis]|uniref:ogr/Delta-like zinc finger family protein n=1 Tax=Chromobacterium phragmitis TaxID=2202141 RepID=UPI000DECF81F|nr:ogr/Delta-like zinc finger family protein [Chromobacterium phragmitis]AXE32259.1 transcriptional regulator [Chromobacterium phragmitis]
MAAKCAHCGSVAYTRSSRHLSLVTQEEYFQCSNIACGHTFTAIREHRETLSPSAMPNPQVRLPQASRAKLAAVRMALNKQLDENQLPLSLDSQ